jgi:adenylate kinase family enzyme
VGDRNPGIVSDIGVGTGWHHENVRRVVVLGRGGAGKSTFARRLGGMTGLPVDELDTLFWQPGLAPSDPGPWAARQQELLQRDTWILDGDLGPYDTALDARLQAADTIIVLDFTFWRCAWQSIRREREAAGTIAVLDHTFWRSAWQAIRRGRNGNIYWRWVSQYRRKSLPAIMQAIAAYAPHAKVHVLRSPGMTRRFLAELQPRAGNGATAASR